MAQEKSSWKTRQEVNKWWLNATTNTGSLAEIQVLRRQRHYFDHCLIYNTGFSLYIGNSVDPGMFIEEPLQRYPDHICGSVDIGDIWVSKQKHLPEKDGSGPICIVAFTSHEHEKKLAKWIWPKHGMYLVIDKQGKLVHKTVFMPLSWSLTPWGFVS